MHITNGDLGANFTHEKLMAQATAKFTYLTTRTLASSGEPNLPIKRSSLL
jgi:hypothetical protein